MPSTLKWVKKLKEHRAQQRNNQHGTDSTERSKKLLDDSKARKASSKDKVDNQSESKGRFDRTGRLPNTLSDSSSSHHRRRRRHRKSSTSSSKSDGAQERQRNRRHRREKEELLNLPVAAMASDLSNFLDLQNEKPFEKLNEKPIDKLDKKQNRHVNPLSVSHRHSSRSSRSSTITSSSESDTRHQRGRRQLQKDSKKKKKHEQQNEQQNEDQQRNDDLLSWNDQPLLTPSLPRTIEPFTASLCKCK